MWVLCGVNENYFKLTERRAGAGRRAASAERWAYGENAALVDSPPGLPASLIHDIIQQTDCIYVHEWYAQIWGLQNLTFDTFETHTYLQFIKDTVYCVSN